MTNIKSLYASCIIGAIFLVSCGGNDSSEKGSDVTNNQPSDTIINNEERPFSDTVNMSTAGSTNNGGTTTITTGGSGTQAGTTGGSNNRTNSNSTTGGN